MITTDPTRWYNRHGKAVISMASYKKIQANVDSNLALQAEGIFKDIGLNTTTAINVFLKKVVATGGIPFELKETPEQKATRDLVQTISKLPHKEAKSTKDIEDWLNED